MSVMHDWEILEVLQKTTTAAVAASVVPNMPIKYVSAPIAFIVPDDQKYLELVLLVNNRNGDFWGDEKNYRGTLRLILHWPNDGSGAYDPMRILSDITSAFGKEAMLQDIQIYDNPDSGGVLENGAENLYPASIRYQCYKR